MVQKRGEKERTFHQPQRGFRGAGRCIDVDLLPIQRRRWGEKKLGQDLTGDQTSIADFPRGGSSAPFVGRTVYGKKGEDWDAVR